MSNLLCGCGCGITRVVNGSTYLRGHKRRAQKGPDDLRFWSKVKGASSDECWLWTGFVHPHGYGMFTIGSRIDSTRRYIHAHRWAYEYLRCEIPSGLYLDHLCRTRSCVNPWHLEPVTHAENVRRGAAARTHCPHGHEYTAENSRYTSTGARRCRECGRIRGRSATRRTEDGPEWTRP